MFSETKTYNVNGKDYLVQIIRKRIRNSYLKFSKDKTHFVLTTSLLMPLSKLEPFILNSIPKLASKLEQKKQPAFTNDYVYILGEKQPVNFENIGDLHGNLKKDFLPILTQRVRYYESLMGINKQYKIRINNASTRFGSNSRRTNTLAFNVCLYHYTIDVIDSVVVHELAHNFVYNHSKNFYKVVLQYCPDYKNLRKRLLKHQYGKNN